MRELSVVAESLRLVRRARRQFLEMGSMEVGFINPMLDRMADDLQEQVWSDDLDSRHDEFRLPGTLGEKHFEGETH